MDIYELDNLKQALSHFSIHPDDRFGQNFLFNKDVLHAIVAAGEIDKSETVLEIGAGIGSLTAMLASAAGKVVAYEIDRRLLRALHFFTRSFKNITIVPADFLKSDYRALLAEGGVGERFKVVANIPYNITGTIIRTLLSGARRPELIVLLVQKEVGERITAKPGAMSVLALSVQFFGQPEIVVSVPKQDFFPSPKVDSVAVRIKLFPHPRIAVPEKEFFRLVKIGFSAKRKTLLNNLSSGLGLSKDEISESLAKAGIGLNARAQELSLDDWKMLFDALPRDI